ncbi:MAG: PTS sugar transporter subunit IIA, partial [candidate division Zixibacteria bacterium]
MKLSKFSEENLIVFDLRAASKEGVIEELVDLINVSNMVSDKDMLLKDIKDREELVTTGIGY